MFPGPKQPRSHRTPGLAELEGNFAHSFVVQVTKNKGYSILTRQVSDRFIQNRAQIAPDRQILFALHNAADGGFLFTGTPDRGLNFRLTRHPEGYRVEPRSERFLLSERVCLG